MKPEKTYVIYYKTKEGKFQVWNSSTNEIKSIVYADLPKKQCYAMLSFAGHVGTPEDLLRYASDFKTWVNELKNNEIYKINWLSFNSNNTASQLIFSNLSNGKYEHHEPIDANEARWMSKTHNGALTYCKPQTTESFGYDYSLFYPRIFSGNKFYLPSKPGKEENLKQLPDMKELKLGFYRVKITCDVDDFRKVFAFSKDHTYADKSLYQAVKYQEKYNVKIDLIIDGKPNAYIYDTKESGYSIFGRWYKKITELREQFPKNVLVKFLASSLSGQLSSRYITRKSYEQIQEEDLDVGISEKNRYFILKKKFFMKNQDTESSYYELLDTHHQYKFNIRLMPFLTAFARNKIARLAMKDIDHVIRIHTDSVCFSALQIFEKHHSILDYDSLKQEEKTSGMITWKNASKYTKSEISYEVLEEDE